MIIKGIISEDFVNYRLPSMTIMFPFCTFKCGVDYCQNSELYNSDNIDIDANTIVSMYVDNDISESIVFQGLEPFDSWDDLYELIKTFRDNTDDDIIIFTGYNEDEILENVEKLKQFKNIIIKYGRYIPDNEKHFDEVLGVKLSSDNQYARRIS